LGLATDDSADYPWKGTKETCAKPDGGANKIKWNSFTAKGCTELKNRLNASPITIAVNVKPMQNYKSGIFDGCGEDIQVNHDILLVGASVTFWKLKNSFGEGWGEYGFVRVKMGNTCGVCEKDGYGFTYAWLIILYQIELNLKTSKNIYPLSQSAIESSAETGQWSLP
jgi:hypothetical protein